jgi:hypothetical protein
MTLPLIEHRKLHDHSIEVEGLDLSALQRHCNSPGPRKFHDVKSIKLDAASLLNPARRGLPPRRTPPNHRCFDRIGFLSRVPRPFAPFTAKRQQVRSIVVFAKHLQLLTRRWRAVVEFR